MGSIKFTNNFPLNSFGPFILPSLNFSHLSTFSQVTKSKQHCNEIFANFYTWIYINWHILLHEFTNIKYTLKHYLRSLLNLSDVSLKRPKFILMLASPRWRQQFHSCTTKSDMPGFVVYQQITYKTFGKENSNMLYRSQRIIRF